MSFINNVHINYNFKFHLLLMKVRAKIYVCTFLNGELMVKLLWIQALYSCKRNLGAWSFTSPTLTLTLTKPDLPPPSIAITCSSYSFLSSLSSNLFVKMSPDVNEAKIEKITLCYKLTFHCCHWLTYWYNNNHTNCKFLKVFLIKMMVINLMRSLCIKLY